MYTKEVNLVSKDSKGKLRVVHTAYRWDEEQHGYVIYRSTGTYLGKMIEQPELLIQRGKVNRTVTQQAELEFNSICKKYRDKGYKELENPIDSYSKEELEIIVGENISSQNGVPKPMLAKQADKVTNKKIFDKEWYASRKINGVRMLLYLGSDGKIHSQGRGAANYDAAMCEILDHPDLIKIFNEYPNLILDGEGYKHLLSLQQINSVARTQVTANDYSILQFYWYDIVDTSKTFKERLEVMKEIANKLNLSFNPLKQFSEDELRIQFVPQELVSGWNNIMTLHNKFVSEGWEGLVIRDPDKVYKPNGRTNDMIKVKIYLDDTYKVIGFELGLRGSEDMVFICEMKDGRTFKASPLGDRATKEEYVQNFEKYYKNQYADCKYFELSDDLIPLQPKLIAFKYDYEEEQE